MLFSHGKRAGSCADKYRVLRTLLDERGRRMRAAAPPKSDETLLKAIELLKAKNS